MTEVSVEEPNAAREYATGNGVARKYASAEELLENAPKDIIEEDVTDVFNGLTVRVRGLTAAQSAHVKQTAFSMRGPGQSPALSWSQMEITQFELGVIEPKLTHEQVLMLHRMSGRSFAKVIEKLDEISGTNKEQLREAQKEFQESGE